MSVLLPVLRKAHRRLCICVIGREKKGENKSKRLRLRDFRFGIIETKRSNCNEREKGRRGNEFRSHVLVLGCAV